MGRVHTGETARLARQSARRMPALHRAWAAERAAAAAAYQTGQAAAEPADTRTYPMRVLRAAAAAAAKAPKRQAKAISPLTWRCAYVEGRFALEPGALRNQPDLHDLWALARLEWSDLA